MDHEAVAEQARLAEARQNELIGRIVTTSTKLERWARQIAGMALSGIDLSRRPWEQLLVGKPIRDAQALLEITSAWHGNVAPWVPDAVQWMKEASKAVERRNELVHREISLKTVVFYGPNSSKNWSGPGLSKSRRSNNREPLRDQHDTLLADLEELERQGVHMYERADAWVESRFDLAMQARVPPDRIAQKQDRLPPLG